jgi:hypothetical protein
MQIRCLQGVVESMCPVAFFVAVKKKREVARLAIVLVANIFLSLFNKVKAAISIGLAYRIKTKEKLS